MQGSRKVAHTGNDVLFIIMAVIYVSVLFLFGWQTWFFVSWLFPDQQLLMKLLTILCFDVMSAVWALLDLFYRYASKGAKNVVRIAWAISFVLSTLASVFYLILESMLRFNVTITNDQVNTGYGVTITSVTLTVIFITWFLYLEWRTRHPSEYEFIASPDADAYRDERDGYPPLPAPPSPDTNTKPMPSLSWLFKKEKETAPAGPSLNDADIVRIIKESITSEMEALKKNVTPPPQTEPVKKPRKKKSEDGEPGRYPAPRVEFAKKWVRWERTGFDNNSCPWKNPYEFRKRRPPQDLYEVACKALDSEVRA